MGPARVSPQVVSGIDDFGGDWTRIGDGYAAASGLRSRRDRVIGEIRAAAPAEGHSKRRREARSAERKHRGAGDPRDVWGDQRSRWNWAGGEATGYRVLREVRNGANDEL